MFFQCANLVLLNSYIKTVYLSMNKAKPHSECQPFLSPINRFITLDAGNHIGTQYGLILDVVQLAIINQDNLHATLWANLFLRYCAEEGVLLMFKVVSSLYIGLLAAGNIGYKVRHMSSPVQSLFLTLNIVLQSLTRGQHLRQSRRWSLSITGVGPNTP